ncbi:MAG: hypothetical protein IKX44_06530 [Prevotella sp.]|nr:hypothetical protein [Prevotella sp.]
MRVNIFESVKAPWPQETELDKIVHMMEFSQELCNRTQVYRKNLTWGPKKKVKNLKITRFPAFTPNAILYEGKTRQHVLGLTDLCFLDLDHIDDKKKIEKAINVLRNDSHVVLASRSVSGQGVHILIRYQLKDMEAPPQRGTMTADEMQNMFGEVYDYLAAKYLLKLGLEADMEAAHMEHMYIVSYDPNLYYNPHAEPLQIDLNEFFKSGHVRPFSNQINSKIEKAKELLSKNRIDEAERLLVEFRDLCLSISGYSDGEAKENFSLNIPSLDDLLQMIMDAKEKVVKANELLTKVDECIQNNNFSDANLMIGVCNKLLKTKSDHPCKQLLDNTKQKVAEIEKKMVAVNKLLKQEKKNRQNKIREEQEYKREMIYIIEKFGELQNAYNLGNMEDCYNILETISIRLDVLPEDENTDVLREQYQKWYGVFYELS